LFGKLLCYSSNSKKEVENVVKTFHGRTKRIIGEYHLLMGIESARRKSMEVGEY